MASAILLMLESVGDMLWSLRFLFSCASVVSKFGSSVVVGWWSSQRLVLVRFLLAQRCHRVMHCSGQSSPRQPRLLVWSDLGNLRSGEAEPRVPPRSWACIREGQEYSSQTLFKHSSSFSMLLSPSIYHNVAEYPVLRLRVHAWLRTVGLNRKIDEACSMPMAMKVPAFS